MSTADRAEQSRRIQRAARMADIQPFYAMEVLDRAYRMQQAGRSVIHLEVGEPDFPTPEPVVAAGIEALRAGHTKYTPALGIPGLREAVADHYPAPVRPDPRRVAITPGSSGALQLAFAVLLDPGDEVLLTDPGYPCNRNLIRLFGGVPRGIAVDAANNYQLTAQLIREHWTGHTRAVLLASPSNPTGTVVPPDQLREIVATVDQLGGVLLMDEIYHGLTYDAHVHSVLHESQQAWVINSFSKYFGMTGWRLGWMVVPETYVDDVNKLAQNLFISPSAPAQYAGVRAFSAGVIAELEQRRRVFRERRDYLLPALRELGLVVPVQPEGAFYLYADCSGFTEDSEAFALDLLEQTGVAITPGRDFGTYRAREHVRFSYANTLENLAEAVSRIRDYLSRSS